MLSNASDPTGGKRASGLARSLSVRSGSLLCARRTQVGKKIQTRQGRSSVEVGGCGLYRAFWAWWRARARTYTQLWRVGVEYAGGPPARFAPRPRAIRAQQRRRGCGEGLASGRRTPPTDANVPSNWRGCAAAPVHVGGREVLWLHSEVDSVRQMRAAFSTGSIRPHRAYEAHCRVGHLARRGRHLLGHPHVTRMAAREEEEL